MDHPDELLDKARAGRLDDKESAALEAHLRECMTCRFELRTSFEAPSSDRDASIIEAAVQKALESIEK